MNLYVGIMRISLYYAPKRKRMCMYVNTEATYAMSSSTSGVYAPSVSNSMYVPPALAMHPSISLSNQNPSPIQTECICIFN